MATKKPKDEKDKQEGAVSKFRSVALDKIAAGIAVVVVAAAVAFFGGLLPDFAEMRYTPPRRVVIGDTVKIDPVIEPRWWTLRHGRFVISSISANLEPGRRESAFDIKPVKSPMLLSELLLDGPLVYTPVSEGVAEIKAELRSGREGDDRSLFPAHWTFAVERHHPYGGQWTLRLGDKSGTVIFHPTPGDPEGVYGLCLIDGAQGLVRGRFDGAQLTADLTLGEATVRWHIVAPTSKADGTLQAAGDAVAHSVQDGVWAPMTTVSPVAFSIRKSIER